MKRAFWHLTTYNLRVKLFFSHLLVALVGTLTFVAVSVVASVLLGRVLWPEDGGSVGWALLRLSVAAGLSTLAAVATTLFVAERITAPVRRMLAATRRVSAGRYGERVPVQEPDELGELSEGFNAMAAALQEDERRRREFIADVSHELRTPLSTLEGYVEGVMDGVVEPTGDAWAVVYAETERMRRLVDDLQRLSRAESGRLALDISPTSPRVAVGRAVEGMLPLFVEKGVEVAGEIPDGLPQVAADPDRLAQVLTNLLGNALRHTPKGGTVTVGAENAEAEVVFRIEDTGTGIAPEHLPRVFERFYRVEKSRSRDGGGSGLGLAISRALVEAMGGGIRAESAGEGTGAAFVFTLPLAVAGQA